MRKIILFMMTSVDGFFEGPNHEIDWHRVDGEFNAFAGEQLDSADLLLFGRKTYELMASYWPKEHAKKDDPIAGRMNSIAKIAFSRTFERVDWENTKLIREHVAEEVKKLKEQSGKNILIFGSNNLSVGFIEMGLLDEIRVMVNPVALGKGHAFLTGIKNRLDLKLMDERKFANGNVFLSYKI